MPCFGQIASGKQAIDDFLRIYKWIDMTYYAWNPSHAGSGLQIYCSSFLILDTGVVANSRALLWSVPWCLNSGLADSYYIDWSKKLEIHAIISRYRSDAEVIARVQLKEANTEGILAARGIGFEINNYVLVGEAYGTARQTATLVTLTNNRAYHIKIVLAGGQVKFYVDRVLIATLTGTAIPPVGGVPWIYQVNSIINGATGGIAARLYIGNIRIIQEW